MKVFLFDKTLETGVIPNNWKQANINAFYKGNGSSNDVLNYRPISVTLCFSKIIEKIVFKYLYNYLLENSIITKHKLDLHLVLQQLINSCLYLMKLLVIWTRVRNLDLFSMSKAFDRVWHKGLIHKLRSYGIDGNLLLWFENYLKDRLQRVSTEGYHSQFRTINTGEPQGSILGPLLCLLYIYDITDNVSTNIKLFADDTSLYVIIDKNPVQAAQDLSNDLVNISEWAYIWDINFNTNKTKSVVFSRKHNNVQPPISFQNNQITDSKTYKHLGLTFTDDASWKPHKQIIYEKTYNRLNILRYIKSKVGRKSLINIYIAFIRPILEYADIVWDNCTLQY